MRALSIPLLGLLVLACGRSSSEEQALRARLASLRADGRLPVPAAVEPEPAAEVRAFFERFEASRARLARNPPATDDRAALAAFQAEAAALVELPVCRAALSQRESLARPLRQFPPSPAAALVDTPELAVVREWTELLCARARLEAGRSGGGPAARASLVTALELLSVWNDRSLIGEVVCSSQERVVLETLRALAPLASIDAGALRKAVDPYLRPRSHAELVRTVTLEIDWWMRAVDGLLASGERVSPAEMEQLGFPGASFGAATHAILDRYEAILDLREDACFLRRGEEEVEGPRLGYALGEWHERNVRLARTRLELAVVAWHRDTGAWPGGLAEVAGAWPGGLPEVPCECLGFELVRDGDGVRVTTVERGGVGHGQEGLDATTQ